MSEIDCLKSWLTLQKDLKNLIEEDRTILESDPIEFVRPEIFNKILPLYYRYRVLIQRLTHCHDIIVQPQIRRVMRKILDCAIARMLEYRREIVNLVFIESPWPNDYLFDAKLTPDNLDLSAPIYDYAGPRLAAIELRKKLVEDLKNKKRTKNSSDEWSTESETKYYDYDGDDDDEISEKLSIDDEDACNNNPCAAILLIQSHERARIGRRAAKEVERQVALAAKLLAAGEDGRKLTTNEADVETKNRAATIIQKIWRSWLARRYCERKRERIDEIIGAMRSRRRSNAKSLSIRDTESTKNWIAKQTRVARTFIKTVESEREEIWERRGPELARDAKGEIRDWLILWHKELNFFDSLPPAEFGGSLLISTGQVRTPAEYMLEDNKDDKKKEKGKEENDEEEDEEEEEENLGWKMQESKAMSHLLDLNDDFDKNWTFRFDNLLTLITNSENNDETMKNFLFVDHIREELCYELNFEVRRVVDEEMQEEIFNMKQALIADLASDGIQVIPPLRPANFEELQPLKVPGDNDEIGEKIATILENPDDQELRLMLELLEEGILKFPDYDEKIISSYDWPLAVSSVKYPVQDYCVLPIASHVVQNLTPLVRTVCICGFLNNGQDFVVKALCSDLKATVFDLTPEKLAGRFVGRSKQNKLAQGVVKLAKAYAPSVIVGGESAWLKTVRPELQYAQPKRFMLTYKKIVNKLNNGDQVLFVTISYEPYLTNNQFIKFHDKFIIVPIPDYGSLCSAYKSFLEAHHNIDARLPISALARVGRSKTPYDEARRVVDDSVPISRRMNFRRKPLKVQEFYDRWLASNEIDVIKALMDEFEKFKAKLPLEIEKRKVEELENEAQQAKKKEKK